MKRLLPEGNTKLLPEGNTKRTLTKEEAARILGVSKETVHRQIKAGKIPAVRIGRRVLVPADFVEALLRKWEKDSE